MIQEPQTHPRARSAFSSQQIKEPEKEKNIDNCSQKQIHQINGKMIVVNKVDLENLVHRRINACKAKGKQGEFVIIDMVVSDTSVNGSEIGFFNVKNALFGNGLNSGKTS